jgi:hypothetical protein
MDQVIVAQARIEKKFLGHIAALFMVVRIAEGVAVIDQVITKSWWFSPSGAWTLSAPHNKSVKFYK